MLSPKLLMGVILKPAPSELLADLEYLTWLKRECGYLDPRPLPEGHWVAIAPLLVTHAIISGRIGDRLGYDNRWCYGSYEKAKAAMDEWSGVGEPEGWHRHPLTGRRRNNGDPTAEYVAF